MKEINVIDKDGSVKVLALPGRTALESAYAEIRSLSMRHELMGNVMLGPGELSPADVAENKRKNQERSRLRLDIIAKYQVEEHFLSELRQDAARYRANLERVERKIAELEKSLASRRS